MILGLVGDRYWVVVVVCSGRAKLVGGVALGSEHDNEDENDWWEEKGRSALDNRGRNWV